jgi:hypothetical protein
MRPKPTRMMKTPASIIKPLRLLPDAIKPENASGWMFPNTIGGALDLDNLADRVIKPVF